MTSPGTSWSPWSSQEAKHHSTLPHVGALGSKGPGSNLGSTTKKLSDLGQHGLHPKTQFPAL